MRNEQNEINEAFEAYLQSYLSKDASEKIASRYGAEIAEKVRNIYKDALNCEVDWRTAAIETGLDAMHRLLDVKYPRISAKARTNINHAFIMSWK
jgi:triphosphoribosyl-dephospho-CoA synthetase